MYNFQVWTKYESDFKVYNYETKELKIYSNLPLGINSFYLDSKFKSHKENKKIMTQIDYDNYIDLILLEYADKLIEWRNEILNCKTFTTQYD